MTYEKNLCVEYIIDQRGANFGYNVIREKIEHNFPIYTRETIDLFLSQELDIDQKVISEIQKAFAPNSLFISDMWIPQGQTYELYKHGEAEPRVTGKLLK